MVPVGRQGSQTVAVTSINPGSLCFFQDQFVYCDSALLLPSCLLTLSLSPKKIYFFVDHPEF